MSHSNKESVGAREAREARERGENPHATTIAALRADLAAKDAEIARLREAIMPVLHAVDALQVNRYSGRKLLQSTIESVWACAEGLRAALKEPPHAE